MSFRYKDYFIVKVLINLGTNGLKMIIWNLMLIKTTKNHKFLELNVKN